jgi:hypothetical protein
MHTINTQTHTLANGYAVRIRINPDTSTKAPWDSSDGHGPVSGWLKRDKKPGEWVLNAHCGDHRFYDAAEATRIAERDSWGLGADAIQELVARLKKADASELTRGEIIAEAVRRDYELLREWCNDEWPCIGLTAELIRESKHGMFEVLKELTASYWGLDSGGRFGVFRIEGIESAVICE